jgi:transcriptional regulator with XRE-family HTH domain
LRQIREARERTQAEIAEKLQINQAAVSKLERRTDMYLSTLRGYIEAMGGTLEVIAHFPDRDVAVTQFERLDQIGGEPSSRTPRAARKGGRARAS